MRHFPTDTARSVFHHPGTWREFLLAAFAFFALFAVLPERASAVVSYGAQVSHQQNETDSGGNVTSTTQDRLGFFLNLNTRPSSRLTLGGNFRFDVLQDERDPGGDSTELQPNIEVRFATSPFQLGLGYREILRDESIISGTSTKNLRTDSKDVFVDGTLRAGRLPDIRLRYSVRDQKQDSSDGTTNADTSTDDFRAAMNYRLGIFSVNADYLNQTTKDRMGGVNREQSQIAGQVSATKAIGSRITLSARENYNRSESSTGGVSDAERYTSVSEARLLYNPFRGAQLTTNYIYNMSEDVFAGLGSTTETTWYTAAAYSLPKYLRFYGSYNMRETDAPASDASNDTLIGGANFNYTAGRFGLVSRFETSRESSSTTDASFVTTERDSSRYNLDWQISSNLGRYLGLALSEAYVSNTVDDQTTTNNRFRLKANIGPIKSLILSPYADYVIDTASDGRETKTTEFVVPATFRQALGRRMDFSFTDSYRWNKTESEGFSTVSQTNSAVFRLGYTPKLGTSLAADASFYSTSSNGTSSSTTTYTLRANWARSIHAVGANIRYQTGSNTPDSANLAFQYGLNLRLPKVTFGFQARYDYTVTYATDVVPESTAQIIYLVLNLRK